MMSFHMRRARVLVGGLLLALIGYGLMSALGDGTKHGVAYFDSVTSVYEHDKVRILGVEVGTIDKITPEDGQVRVEFSYDGSYDLPADVKAAVVSPTLVATRFLQLEPAYSSGPTFPDDGVIPVERTASPLEFDDLKSELSRLSTTLGPNGKDVNGALADFLNVAAKNGKGRGTKFNQMITDLSQGLHTLAEGRGDIFGTLRNLQVFVSAVKALDSQVSTFNTRLAGVSDLLDDNGADLTAAIKSVDKAANLVNTFVDQNRAQLAGATDRLADLTTTLATSRDDIATLLHAGPNTLTNFYNIFSPRMSSFSGGLMVDNLGTPGELICTLIAQQTGAPSNDLTGCGKYLAPLLNQFGISELPVGTNGGVTIPGGGGPIPGVPPAEAAPGVPPGSTIPPSLDGVLGLLMPGGPR
jgi:phospholipid/cholesterol/gamma-HCH transport system substrate-binding protein